jgi:hypothetical protein
MYGATTVERSSCPNEASLLRGFEPLTPSMRSGMRRITSTSRPRWLGRTATGRRSGMTSTGSGRHARSPSDGRGLVRGRQASGRPDAAPTAPALERSGRLAAADGSPHDRGTERGVRVRSPAGAGGRRLHRTLLPHRSGAGRGRGVGGGGHVARRSASASQPGAAPRGRCLRPGRPCPLWPDP